MRSGSDPGDHFLIRLKATTFDLYDLELPLLWDAKVDRQSCSSTTLSVPEDNSELDLICSLRSFFPSSFNVFSVSGYSGFISLTI